MKAQRTVLSLILALGCLSARAYALPLLAQNAAQNTSEALTLYPDHLDPNLFYYMPNSSEMARERGTGLPMFGFTYWGLNAGTPVTDAGAYMVFSMRLKSDASQDSALKAAIASGKRVAVLPLMQSMVNLTSTAQNQEGRPAAAPLGRLFEEFNFAQRGGLAEQEVGVNAILTGIGARVMKAQLDTPAALKIDYCYKIQGLGPNFDASIHINWERVYFNFQTRASFGGFWARKEIAAEIERLRQEGHIRIDVNGGDAKDEEYVQALAERIATRLFVASLSDQPTSGDGQGWSFSSFQLKVTDRRELKTETYNLTRRELVTREFCTPLMLSEIRAHRAELIRNADGGAR
jgi:hypothetical protein